MKKSPFLSPVFHHAIYNLAKTQVENETKEKLAQNKLVKPTKKRGKPIGPLPLPQPKIFCRNSILPTTALGYSFIVSNGLGFLKVFVSEKIIGHKLGEFCQTRKRYFFKKKNKNKR